MILQLSLISRISIHHGKRPTQVVYPDSGSIRVVSPLSQQSTNNLEHQPSRARKASTSILSVSVQASYIIKSTCKPLHRAGHMHNTSIPLTSLNFQQKYNRRSPSKINTLRDR
ncbi:hypothetical protein Nepgr_016476 [Nepenthes gracilis]|uniref:Uncharacterized protein n=1 Tax=Nepenthes gracilis TaxID=150966 RepID=A0AAD3SPU9_NEPGR|nr:hypothetical protein Nepgr_016476 [Nepenthes gracilis]